MTSPKTLIGGDDPISRDAVKFLVGHKEEDDVTDYKLTFHPENEKSWLDLTIDVSAFANTYGGFLIFGVEDKSKKLVGISKNVADTLNDSNNLLQKVNRYLEPHITGLRSKTYKIEGKTVGVVFVPQSQGRTHIVSKDGSFSHPSGKTKLRIRQGTFYVRRSGGIHLGDSRDLDDLIERRIDQFRVALLDKVTKVIRTPAASDVFILSKDPEDETGKRFVIEDGPDSIPIKGMSFTVAPEGTEEEVAAWTVICSGDSAKIPPPKVLWGWYEQRENIELRKGYKLPLFQFSLWSDIPAFFWIKGLKNADIRAALLEAIRKRPAGNWGKQMLVAASFLGKSSYKVALSALGNGIGRLSPSMKSFPSTGPRKTYGTVARMPKQTLAAVRKESITELDEITRSPSKTGKPPALAKRWRAHGLDCFLYAQDDRYR